MQDTFYYIYFTLVSKRSVPSLSRPIFSTMIFKVVSLLSATRIVSLVDELLLRYAVPMDFYDIIL